MKAFDWLHDLKLSVEYSNYLEVRDLLPEEIWDNYKILEVTGLIEIEMLGIAASKLRKLWKQNRPPLFNRDRETDREDN